ncbi:MAG TPA: hypothetical protein GXX60_03795 [Anaerolineaceae bacterium]|nr:hypothetical protein [Anaerolineaceae bacterium]
MDWLNSGDADVVSIHASTREATAWREVTPLHRGFNPRLHAGGDGDFHQSPSVVVVSIHASTREATACPV